MPDFGDVDPNTGRPSARTGYEGTIDPLAPSVANGQITPAQWAEYQKKRRRAAVIGLIGTVGGMLAAPAASYGAGAAAASVPGAVGAADAPLGTGTVVGGAGGIGAGAGTGVGATAAGVGSTIGRQAGDLALGASNGMSARDWIALATSLAGITGGALSNRPDLGPNSQTTDPNMQKLISTMQGRLDQSEPLYKSIMAMANGLLPTQYQNGGAGR